ncbi:hypothetical protein [Tenacibaculum amylolyticum]|uniref:hypothetical protein n=1 Tax=Tenacibaculum amylolyticum TaxID=104269 RepID=UPI003894F65E
MGKSKLEKLQLEFNKQYPQLLEIAQNEIIIPDPLFSTQNLLFLDEDRSCRIYLYGREEMPRFVLEWDECKIIEIRNEDYKRVGKIIEKWVFEKTIPSLLKKESPELAFCELAYYYEKGEGIKGEFIKSWDEIEIYYREYPDSNRPFTGDALKLIQEMRNEGLDEVLRAGQSLWFFLISRERRHGIANNRPYVQINFLGKNKMVVKIIEDYEEEYVVESEVKYKGVLEKIIQELLKLKIK